MKPPQNFVRILEGRRYSTETATLLAGDDYFDGKSFERDGRNRFLYKSPKGQYFTVVVTMWEGERDFLLPIDLEEAIRLYEGPLTEHRVPYSEAFPGVTVEDA